jgi:hypothetical protein
LLLPTSNDSLSFHPPYFRSCLRSSLTRREAGGRGWLLCVIGPLFYREEFWAVTTSLELRSICATTITKHYRTVTQPDGRDPLLSQDLAFWALRQRETAPNAAHATLQHCIITFPSSHSRSLITSHNHNQQHTAHPLDSPICPKPFGRIFPTCRAQPSRAQPSREKSPLRSTSRQSFFYLSLFKQTPLQHTSPGVFYHISKFQFLTHWLT